MRSHRWFPIFLLSSFILSAVPNVVGAADLLFSANTTLSMSGITFTTVTVASGSEATILTVDATTLTVTVPSGSTFTLRASSDITFTNTSGVTTTCGATSSLALPGPKTNLVVTPTNTPCPRLTTTRSSTATALLISPPLPAPTRVQANATTVSVTLTWIDPIAENFDAISIFRNKGGGSPISGVVYTDVAKGVQQYTDRNVLSGETYKYLVRAIDAGGNTDGNSSEIVITVANKLQKVEEEKKEEKKPEESKKEEVKQEEQKVEEKTQETQKEKIKKEEQREEVKTIVTADTTAIARSAGRDADPVIEQTIRTEEKFSVIIANGEEAHTTAAVGFIAYGTETTEKLGEGERAGVLDSYKKAYGALPATESEWQDALSIAAGEKPIQENSASEARAISLFKKIYKRVPVIAYSEGDGTVLRAQENADQQALTILAYGIRPETRDLDKERKGIGAFKSLFGNDPKTAEDWDAVRMMAYASLGPP